MKIAAVIAPCLLASTLLASWQMFSDGSDTYLYNTQSGDVYIRYKRGGKNFEDMFVKMPAGVVPNAPSAKSRKDSLDSALSTAPTPTAAPTTSTTPAAPESSHDKLLKQQQEALQKSQELLRNSIDSASAIE